MRRMLAVAGVYLALSLAVGAVLAERAFHRPRTLLAPGDHRRASALAAAAGGTLETVTVRAGDGARLEGWWIAPGRSNGHTVILLHGITSNRAALLNLADRVLARGYHALAVDGRAHGASDGDLIAFGGREAGDTRRWVEWVRTRQSAGCVFLIGDSLGAAIALQASGESGVCAVVAQSAYTGLREVAFDRVGQMLGTGRWVGQSVFRPAIESGLLFVRLRHGVSPGSASAAIATPGPPVLLIHGERDTNTPVRHAMELQQANPSRVTLWIVPGGGHEGLAAASPDYEERVFAFLAANAERR